MNWTDAVTGYRPTRKQNRRKQRCPDHKRTSHKWRTIATSAVF